jgi:Bacteriophage Sf6, terminase small subunit-like
MAEYVPPGMFPDAIPGETRVMSVEEYERRKREFLQRQRMEKEQEEMRKAHEASEYKRLQPIKNKLEYSDPIANEICERISAGELLIDICNEAHMPTVRRCNQWLRDKPEFQQLYNQSIIDRLAIFEEQVVQIADDASNDYKEVVQRNGSTKKVLEAEAIARAKLRVDVRFRHLKAGKPAKWGDSTTLNLKESDEFDPANFSADELEKQIADIEHKARVVKPVK